MKRRTLLKVGAMTSLLALMPPLPLMPLAETVAAARRSPLRGLYRVKWDVIRRDLGKISVVADTGELVLECDVRRGKTEIRFERPLPTYRTESFEAWAHEVEVEWEGEVGGPAIIEMVSVNHRQTDMDFVLHKGRHWPSRS